MDKIRALHIFHKKINSLIYLTYRNPIVVSAWVIVRYGRVVHHNWGDDINVYLLERITGRRVVVKNQSAFHNRFYRGPVYCCIGSIIGWYETPQTIVWGSGMIAENVIVDISPKRVCSVRGELTRKRLIEQGIKCPAKYGDPTLLISKYYKATPLKRRFKLGIIPHYIDIDNPVLAQFLNAHKEDVLLIDLAHYEKWTDIPDQIVSCDHILSSSLHGLIVSDSYNIPNTWIGFSDKLAGGNYKFYDYFSSVQRSETKKLIASLGNLEDLLQTQDKKNNAIVDFESILASAPFPLKQI